MLHCGLTKLFLSCPVSYKPPLCRLKAAINPFKHHPIPVIDLLCAPDTCMPCVKCVCVYLLDILLEHTQLQPLVQSDLSMLPNVFETPLMVENLVHHIQDAMNL